MEGLCSLATDVQRLRALGIWLAVRRHMWVKGSPRGLGKDVTNLGRWGNGDVEVGLTTLDELPYVMGLVRQAFE